MTIRGLCSVTFRKHSVEDVIALVKDAGLDAIEWGGDTHAPIRDPEKAQKVSDLTRAAGLSVSSYGSYYYAGSDDSFAPYLETARLLGTDKIRVWAKKMDFKKEVGKIDEVEFAQVVRDLKAAAREAQVYDMSIHLECHQGTYTDSTESTKRLLAEIAEPNVFLYWQPLAYLSKEERLEQIKSLGQAISNVHVFHWDEAFNRYPLADGVAEWQDYFRQIEQYSNKERTYLMEFVKDNTESQFQEDVTVFHNLIETR